MQKQVGVCLLALAISCSTQSLAATPMSGPYMRAFGGFAFTPANVHARNFSKLRYRTGYNAGGQFGYKSGPIRYELEGTYIHTKVKRFSFRNVRQTGLSGKATAKALMLNIFYDFEDFNDVLAPYLGVGIGYSSISIPLNSTTPTVAQYRNSKGVFAYQAQAGINYNFAENMSTDLGYRYFRTKRYNSFGRAYQAHLANFGVTYRFDS